MIDAVGTTEEEQEGIAGKNSPTMLTTTSFSTGGHTSHFEERRATT